MNVHCVAFVSATQAEIASGKAFKEAAVFCQWEATVVIRCEQLGQELQTHCVAGDSREALRRFRAAWVHKYGEP